MKTTIKRIRQLIREALKGKAVPATNPDPACPECHGTGLYIGLNSVEPCDTCTKRTTVSGKGSRKVVDPTYATIDRDRPSYTVQHDHTTFEAAYPTEFKELMSIANGLRDRDVAVKDVQTYLSDDGNVEAIITTDDSDDWGTPMVWDTNHKGWFLAQHPQGRYPGDPFESEDWRDPDIQPI